MTHNNILTNTQNVAPTTGPAPAPQDIDNGQISNTEMALLLIQEMGLLLPSLQEAVNTPAQSNPSSGTKPAPAPTPTPGSTPNSSTPNSSSMSPELQALLNAAGLSSDIQVNLNQFVQDNGQAMKALLEGVLAALVAELGALVQQVSDEEKGINDETSNPFKMLIEAFTGYSKLTSEVGKVGSTENQIKELLTVITALMAVLEKAGKKKPDITPLTTSKTLLQTNNTSGHSAKTTPHAASGKAHVLGSSSSGSANGVNSTDLPPAPNPDDTSNLKLQALLTAAEALGDMLSDILNDQQDVETNLSNQNKAMLVALQAVLEKLIEKIQEMEAEEAKARALGFLMKIVGAILVVIMAVIAIVTCNPTFLFLAAVAATMLIAGPQIQAAAASIFKAMGCGDDVANFLGSLLIAIVIAICTMGVGAATDSATLAQSFIAGFVNGAVAASMPTYVLMLIPYIKDNQNNPLIIALLVLVTLACAIMAPSATSGEASSMAAEGEGVVAKIAKVSPKLATAIQDFNKAIVQPLLKSVPQVTAKVLMGLLQKLGVLAEATLMGITAQNDFNMNETQQAKAKIDPEQIILNAVVSANNQSQNINNQNAAEMEQIINKALSGLGQYLVGMEAENQALLQA